MESTVNRTFSLFEEHIFNLEEWKWKYKTNCSQVIRALIDNAKKNPDKLKKIIKERKENEKK